MLHSLQPQSAQYTPEGEEGEVGGRSSGGGGAVEEWKGEGAEGGAEELKGAWGRTYITPEGAGEGRQRRGNMSDLSYLEKVVTGRDWRGGSGGRKDRR